MRDVPVLISGIAERLDQLIWNLRTGGPHRVDVLRRIRLRCSMASCGSLVATTVTSGRGWAAARSGVVQAQELVAVELFRESPEVRID